MSILVKNGTAKWERASPTEFSDEVQLQKFLYESPELIEWQDDQPVVFTRESALPGSGYTDLIGVAANGDILLVETKLAKNPEIRRKVIGQVIEYAAFLWGMEYPEFNQIFLTREGRSLIELLSEKSDQFATEEFENAVAKNLKDGRFYLLIAVDEMNKELERIISYLSSRGSGLKLEALAVRVFTSGNTSVLAPQRFGQLSQPDPPTSTPTKRLTIEEVVDRSPDAHTRGLMQSTVNGWIELGNSIVPGTAGLSCRAETNGEIQVFFWVDPSPAWGIQPLFRSLERQGAPSDAVASYRKAVSELRGFAGSRCLTDARPPAPFSGLTEESVKKFLELTSDLVRDWRSTSSL
jgi:hypothetical protein